MKRIAIGAVVALVVAGLVMGGITAIADKPANVIDQSNGFPSGPHFNLNIHGKNWETCQATWDLTDGWGSSVHVPEYGNATIQYVSNKKSSVAELTVHDPCAGFDGGNDVAIVQLPKDPLGYWVGARILGKPNHGAAGNESNIILDPAVVVAACNDTDPANWDFGNYTSCPNDSLLALGLIVGGNLYGAGPEGFVRFDPASTNPKGKPTGKSKGQDITDLFTWSGWVYDASLDVGSLNTTTSICEAVPDGLITECDVPMSYDTNPVNGVIDPAEFEAWRADQEAAGLATFYAPTWIFNIADLVMAGQDVHNDGAKLLQIRFYPLSTTEFDD